VQPHRNPPVPRQTHREPEEDERRSPPPGAAPASQPPGPLFARPARRRNGHRILDGLEAVRRARARYPDARATREDRRRLSHDVDYAPHDLGDPLAVRRDEHRLLVATQMLSYLRVCDRIVRGYEQCAGLRRYLHKTLLQFEHPWIRDLSESYPVPSAPSSGPSSPQTLRWRRGRRPRRHASRRSR
jgi:hypothetical protein